MVSRIQNRNTGYSDSLFSHNSRVDNNALGSIEGATALKLDERYEINDEQNTSLNFEATLDDQHSERAPSHEEMLNDIPQGVSIESASYMESNNNTQEDADNTSETSDEIIKEYTPRLFSEEQGFQQDTEFNVAEPIKNETEELFDQEINEEEDFEIPAFLRKQKF